MHVFGHTTDPVLVAAVASETATRVARCGARGEESSAGLPVLVIRGKPRPGWKAPDATDRSQKFRQCNPDPLSFALIDWTASL